MDKCPLCQVDIQAVQTAHTSLLLSWWVNNYHKTVATYAVQPDIMMIKKYTSMPQFFYMIIKKEICQREKKNAHAAELQIPYLLSAPVLHQTMKHQTAPS